MENLSVFNGNNLKNYDVIRCELIRLIKGNLDIVNRFELLKDLGLLVQYKVQNTFAGYRGHVNFLNELLPKYGFTIVCNYQMGTDVKIESELLSSDTSLLLFKEVFEADDNLMAMYNYFDKSNSIEEVYKGLVSVLSVESRLDRVQEYYLTFNLGEEIFIHPLIRYYKICTMLNWDLHECAKYAHILKCDYVPKEYLDYLRDTIKFDITIDVFSKTSNSGECLVIYMGRDGEVYNPYYVLPLSGSGFAYADYMKWLPVENSLNSIVELVFTTRIVNLRPLSDFSRITLHGFTKCVYPTPKRFKDLTHTSYSANMSLERNSNLAGISQEASMQLMVNFMDYIFSDEYDKTYCYHFFSTFIDERTMDFIFSEKNKSLLRLFTTSYCKNYLNYLCRIALNYLYMEDRAYVMTEQYKYEEYTIYMNEGCLTDPMNIKLICRALLCLDTYSVKSITLSILKDLISVLNYVTNNRLIRIKMMKYMIGLIDVHVVDINDDVFKMDLICYDSRGYNQTFKLIGDCMQKRIPIISSSGYKNVSKLVQTQVEERFCKYMNTFFTSILTDVHKYLNSYKIMSPSSRISTRTYLVEDFRLVEVSDESGRPCLMHPVRWMPYSYRWCDDVIETDTGDRFELLIRDNGEYICRQLPDSDNLKRTSMFID